jgi:hypothetical protein
MPKLKRGDWRKSEGLPKREKKTEVKKGVKNSIVNDTNIVFPSICCYHPWTVLSVCCFFGTQL